MIVPCFIHSQFQDFLRYAYNYQPFIDGFWHSHVFPILARKKKRNEEWWTSFSGNKLTASSCKKERNWKRKSVCLLLFATHTFRLYCMKLTHLVKYVDTVCLFALLPSRMSFCMSIHLHCHHNHHPHHIEKKRACLFRLFEWIWLWSCPLAGVGGMCLCQPCLHVCLSLSGLTSHLLYAFAFSYSL